MTVLANVLFDLATFRTPKTAEWEVKGSTANGFPERWAAIWRRLHGSSAKKCSRMCVVMCLLSQSFRWVAAPTKLKVTMLKKECVWVRKLTCTPFYKFNQQSTDLICTNLTETANVFNIQNLFFQTRRNGYTQCSIKKRYVHDSFMLGP